MAAKVEIKVDDWRLPAGWHLLRAVAHNAPAAATTFLNTAGGNVTLPDSHLVQVRTL